jgi:dolichol-phosphate mannosyltransferase
MKNIGIVLPAYNERESIYDLLSSFVEVKSEYPIVVIVVDDSSEGVSRPWVARAAIELDGHKQIESITYVNSGRRQGRGGAVQFGFKELNKNPNCVFFIEMDSDGSHPVTSLNRIIELSNSEFVIGSRYLKNSKIIGWPLKRRVFSRIINKLLRIVFGISISDWTNGLRGYSKKSIEKLLEKEIVNTGFIALSETLLILCNSNIKPLEVPIDFFDRSSGKSTVTLKELFASLYGVLILKFRKGV